MKRLARKAIKYSIATVVIAFMLVVGTEDAPTVLGAVLAWVVLTGIAGLFVWLAVGEVRIRLAERRLWLRSHERHMAALRRATDQRREL